MIPGFPALCAFALSVFIPVGATAKPCTGTGIELQVLGSGGPELQTKRASASYILWRDGHARVLIDSGGGSALRFGEAGAVMTDLDVVLFTHLHADHTADFPALIKSSFFEDRTRPLLVYGPTGNVYFPATTAFVKTMFGPDAGAFRYLGGFLVPGKANYAIETHDVKLDEHEIKRVFSKGDMTISTVAVQHGAVPAIAWRIDVAGRSFIFSGDTNGNNGNLEKLAQGGDILVAHNAVPESAVGIERQLHMPPSVIGRIAANAAVQNLVLSHRMLRTLGRESETRTLIEATYHGPINFADDLDCFAVAR